MSLQKNRMIAASKNFQTSVNIAFDFDNAQKLADFIPTSEAIKFIDEAVLSARNINQTEEKTSEKNDSLSRAGILIGPYGKGKSYIVLETLSLLYNNPDLKNVFESLAKKIAEKNPDTAENVPVCKKRYTASSCCDKRKFSEPCPVVFVCASSDFKK